MRGEKAKTTNVSNHMSYDHMSYKDKHFPMIYTCSIKLIKRKNSKKGDPLLLLSSGQLISLHP